MIRGLLKEARPKQWAKNVLVFAAPGAAGVLTQVDDLWRTLVIFAAFCLAASGTYFWNDLLDVEADRAHPHQVAPTDRSGHRADRRGPGRRHTAPRRRHRFVVRAELDGRRDPRGVRAPDAHLQHDLEAHGRARPRGGGRWLRVARRRRRCCHLGDDEHLVREICTTFGSLFIVTGKRYAELREMGDDASTTRATLDQYSLNYLRMVLSVSCGATLVAYCIWAFETKEINGTTWPFYELSIVPMLTALLRYALVLDQGHGSAPEEIFAKDRTIQLLGLAWVIVFGLGVYVS